MEREGIESRGAWDPSNLRKFGLPFAKANSRNSAFSLAPDFEQTHAAHAR
jgi:hypothetical protein